MLRMPFGARAAILAAALIAMGPAVTAPAAAQDAPEAAPAPEFSKNFRRKAGKVQKAVGDQDWPAVLAGLPELESLEDLTRDDRMVMSNWRLVALGATGDREAFAAHIERHLADGFATPDQLGALHQQLAAHYSAKKDNAKTIHHYRAFLEATPDAEPAEFETMGRLYLQVEDFAQGAEWLGRAIELARSRGEAPAEMWFQLRDRAFIETNAPDRRLANLEELVKHYPDKEYYSRIAAMYQARTQDDRIVMLNIYRLAVDDPEGGLATVGGYLSYADTALLMGSPGEAQRALERGMAEGIVPSAGTNQAALEEARTAVANDRRNLASDAKAAADAKGEVDVKVGLGFYSTGNYEKAVELVRRGIGKGGVKRLDDANLLLGAALVRLGRIDEARAAFDAAAAAAGKDTPLGRIAGLWIARTGRAAAAPAVAGAG